jgi:hypothetical protein
VYGLLAVAWAGSSSVAMRLLKALASEYSHADTPINLAGQDQLYPSHQSNEYFVAGHHRFAASGGSGSNVALTIAVSSPSSKTAGLSTW